jgi:hypothetical protein
MGENQVEIQLRLRRVLQILDIINAKAQISKSKRRLETLQIIFAQTLLLFKLTTIVMHCRRANKRSR